jgi:hypothetical protein
MIQVENYSVAENGNSFASGSYLQLQYAFEFYSLLRVSSLAAKECRRSISCMRQYFLWILEQARSISKK